MSNSANFDLESVKSMMPTEAIPLLDSHLAENPDDEEALTLRGLKHWAAGQRSLAIKDYIAAIKINPESKAKLALQSANAILDYYNKDLLNP